MKKAIIYIIAAVAVIAIIAVVHYTSKPPQTPTVSPAVFNVPVGEPVTIQLKYRGISGKDDDLRAYGSYGFGSSENPDSDFIDDVTAGTMNRIFVSRNPYLGGREYTAVEYDGKDVKAVYFDLDGNDALSDDERLEPTDVSRENRRGEDSTAFVTPDFMVTNREGRKVPFRVILWVRFYEGADTPMVMWWPMSAYEGTAKIGGKKMKFYLFPDFIDQSYTAFGGSDYALVDADYDNNGYVPRRNLSSLIVQDGTFYRLAVQRGDAQTLFVTLAEDKSPRGKITFNVQGNDGFKSNVNNATLRGAADSTIYYSISGGMNELPEGDYVVSSGYLTYGDDGKYSTSFGSLPAFTVKADQTATIELGKPQVKVRAVELNKRYNSNREYKTEFTEDTPVYLDVSYAGMHDESYRGFQQQVQMENYTTSDYIKAQMAIVDADGKTVVDEALEPG